MKELKCNIYLGWFNDGVSFLLDSKHLNQLRKSWNKRGLWYWVDKDGIEHHYDLSKCVQLQIG